MESLNIQRIGLNWIGLDQHGHVSDNTGNLKLKRLKPYSAIWMQPLNEYQLNPAIPNSVLIESRSKVSWRWLV